MIKLCKDCKHYKRDWSSRIIGLEDKFDLCLHPLVTGNVVTGWHYWATAVGGGSINWYRDGSLINTTNGVAALGTTAGTTLTIGNDYYSTYLAGYINSIQVYNRVLSTTEVNYNYNADKWKFKL